MFNFKKAIPRNQKISTLLSLISIMLLLLVGLQNCNPYVSNSYHDNQIILGSTISDQKSSYATMSNSVQDIYCSTNKKQKLSMQDFLFIESSEAAFSQYRYMVIHPQPVDFSGSTSHFAEISSEFSQNFKSFRPATSLTVFGFEERDLCATERRIKNAFSKSVEFDLPLLIHIDFEWFIDSRPDIWNWYLPNFAGYNENNKFKVEWSGWNEPLKKYGIFWDVAGLERKARICYSNPSIQLEVVQKARFFAALINEWRLELAKMNKSYLFVGIDPGWETGIQNYSNFTAAKNKGVNYNMGYCALHYEGYSQNNPPTNPEAVLEEVVRKYAKFESQIFYEAGLPKNKIFTHIAAFDGDKISGPHPNAPFRQRGLVEQAFNEFSTPGFSIYPEVYFPDSILRNVRGREWSIIETAYSDFEHLNVFAGDPNLKHINIYSWDLVKIKGQVQNIKNLMNFPINYGEITGWIDGVYSSNDKQYLSGWACAQGYGEAVGLHIYANAPYPNGTLLTSSVKTNVSAEEGVAASCSVGVNRPLRFSFEIPSSIKQSYGGQSIYIYGIHPSGEGSKNKLLGNSGMLKIPLMTEQAIVSEPKEPSPVATVVGEITGWIDGISILNGKQYLSGWACAQGYGEAVGLHIYANAPYPNGTLLTGSVKTNTLAEKGIAAACSVGVNRPLRFSFEVPSSIKQSYGGQSIYIYGIHPSGEGSKNKLLGNSGNIKVPVP